MSKKLVKDDLATDDILIVCSGIAGVAFICLVAYLMWKDFQ